MSNKQIIKERTNKPLINEFDIGISHRLIDIKDDDIVKRRLFYMFLNDIDDELVFNIIPQINELWEEWIDELKGRMNND
tara:strand:+ start:195 stop:431 length:237 start_codon:yes stop_codon:yes gene_type:complete